MQITLKKPIALLLALLMALTPLTALGATALATDEVAEFTEFEEPTVELGDVDEPVALFEGDSLEEAPPIDEPEHGDEPMIAAVNFAPFSNEPTLYDITITPPSNGSITADFATAEANTTVTLVVTANDAYKLRPDSISVVTSDQLAPRQIRGTGTDADPYTFVMPAANVTVKAEFIRISTVTVAAGIQHGTITTDVSSGVAGETVRITVTPDDGYRLKFNSTLNQQNKSLKATFGDSAANVNIPDTYYDPNTATTTDFNVAATSYSFTMPAGDVTITAEFTEAFTITLDNMANGALNLNGKTVAGEGERVQMLAVPDAGYQVKAGSVKIVDSDQVEIAYNSNYSEFMMVGKNVVVSAEFEEMPKLEGLDFAVTAGDADATVSFKVPSQWFSANVFYRIKGSGDAYKSQNAYTGNLAVGNTFTVKISGLTNDEEYEFYLSSTAGTSDIVYATPSAIAPSGVYINRTSANVVVGETMALFAEVLPTDSKAKDLTWTSNNESVATVGEHGVVTAIAPGEAQITVTSDVGGKTAVCYVSVIASNETPSGGSVIFGTVDALYGDSGGTVEMPLTVIVPTDRPIFEFDISIAPGTAATAHYSVTSISLDGTNLPGSTTTQVDDLNVRIGTALPLTANYNSGAVIVATPQSGKFLEAGKTYEFTLTISIKSTAPPVIPVSFSSSTNYSSTFYYYDYDYSPTRDRFALAAQRQAGTINAIWMGDGSTPPFGGSGVAAAYYISTAEHLVWYAQQYNDGLTTIGATLFNDIDLTNTAFDGLGTAERPYTPRFTGNNNTVTYNMTQSTDGAVGFIRYASNAIISTLKLEGTITVTSGNVKAGGIVGELSGGNGSIANSTSNVDITVTGTAGGYVGGIAGYVESTTTTYAGPVGNCTNLGTIIADGTNVIAVGGIAGYVKNPNRISATGNGGKNGETVGIAGTGAITGRGYVGGIVGILECTSTKEMTDNTNFAPITSLSGEATGGIAGKVVMAHVGGTYNGADRTQYPNRNYSDVTGATKYVGGIVGTVENSAAERIALNFNTGTITSTSTVSGAAVGGIVAHTTGSETVTIADNINIGTLIAPNGTKVGGVLGTSDNPLSEELCVGNYYADVDGLEDAVFSLTAPKSWLSISGWSPQYSGTGGDGSASDPYQIATLYDFLWFTKQVNSGDAPGNSPGSNYNVILVTDIDLSDYPAYEGIGTSSYPSQTYHGTFDGNGHTITVALDGTSPGGQALMGRMAIFRSCSGAVIKNLTVEGSVRGSLVAGVALQFDGGYMENVHNYADVTNVHDENVHYNQNASNGQAAGIISNGSPTLLKNVTNHGTIYGHNASGLACTIVSSAVIEDCVNYGDVTACMLAAGVVGSMGAGLKSSDGKPSLIIRNTRNEGTITSKAPVVLDNVAWYNNVDPSTNHTAGGILGKVDNAIVELNNVTNNGTVQGSGNNIGGILGTSTFGDYQDTDFRIINSTNNGDVRSTYNGDTDWHLSHISVGGIVGNTSGTFDMSSVWNPHGSPGHTQKATITGSVNNGNVSGPAGANVGAIAGLVTGNPDSGSVINIDGNYTSVDVNGSGNWNSVGGNTYDPGTHKIENGQLVELNPTTPPGPVTPPVPPNNGITPPVNPPVPDDNDTTQDNNQNTPDDTVNPPAPPTPPAPVVPLEELPSNIVTGGTIVQTVIPPQNSVVPDLGPLSADSETSILSSNEEGDTDSETESESEAQPPSNEPVLQTEVLPEITRETLGSSRIITSLIVAVAVCVLAAGGFVFYRKSRAKSAK